MPTVVLITTLIATPAAVSGDRVGAASGATSSAAWVVDPSLSGPDRPPAGASLFDQITTGPDGRREVPFPFEALVESFEAAAGCRPCARSVLLPLGRSLQRVAASPDFFAYPRVVTAVTGDGRGPWLLRDRLYLGYQERAGLIEVISYNEAAGRFEFQVVKNYRAGAVPQVFQARRAVCLACHQNHAPLFSRQVWGETNANPQIVERFGRMHSYHGVAVQGSTDISNAIDDATDRSNRLALVRRLWIEGCGVGEVGTKCRTAAFAAATQFALTDRRAYETDEDSYQGDLVATLERNGRRLWPAGLAVPNPDLPNRDPLEGSLQLANPHPRCARPLPEGEVKEGFPSPSGRGAGVRVSSCDDGSSNTAAALSLSHVPAQLEPLLPRPPLEVLSPDGERLAAVLVSGIAESLPAVAIDDLGVALDALDNRDRRRAHQARCEVHSTGGITRFRCSGGFELSGASDGSFVMVDALGLRSDSVVRNLHLPMRKQGAAIVVTAPKIRDRSVRLPDGNAVASISIDELATMTTVASFDAARPAMADAITFAPEEPHAARLSRVAARLRGRDVAKSNHTVIPADVESVPIVADAVALTAPFESQCGACHHTADRSPPNFLSGDARRVREALASCAPRIYVRLAMNGLPSARRDKTPMPPERPLRPGEHAANTDVRALRSHVESLLREEYGRVPAVADLLSNGYERLRSCLPEGGA